MFLVVGYLLAMHIYLLLSNLTTIDNLLPPDQKLHFHKGSLKKNCLSVMGPHPIRWFLPMQP